MRYLIVNADDFGYSQGINKGIIEAHTNGIVTSTSVMVDAIASNEAADLGQYPELSVGLHFVLGSDDARADLTRQVEKFISITGHKPDHLDTHKMRPTDERVRAALEAYAKENGVPVRCLGFAKFIDSYIGLSDPDGVTLDSLRRAIDQATDEYNELMCHVGYSDHYLRQTSSYNDLREAELQAITDSTIKKYLEEKKLVLCNWSQISQGV
jgi:predicted glycoside hydrolase/deacetylase ChbG (UPF0249 family)